MMAPLIPVIYTCKLAFGKRVFNDSQWGDLPIAPGSGGIESQKDTEGSASTRPCPIRKRPGVSRAAVLGGARYSWLGDLHQRAAAAAAAAKRHADAAEAQQHHCPGRRLRHTRSPSVEESDVREARIVREIIVQIDAAGRDGVGIIEEDIWVPLLDVEIVDGGVARSRSVEERQDVGRCRIGDLELTAGYRRE